MKKGFSACRRLLLKDLYTHCTVTLAFYSLCQTIWTRELYCEGLPQSHWPRGSTSPQLGAFVHGVSRSSTLPAQHYDNQSIVILQDALAIQGHHPRSYTLTYYALVHLATAPPKRVPVKTNELDNQQKTKANSHASNLKDTISDVVFSIRYQQIQAEKNCISCRDVYVCIFITEPIPIDQNNIITIASAPFDKLVYVTSNCCCTFSASLYCAIIVLDIFFSAWRYH